MKKTAVLITLVLAVIVFFFVPVRKATIDCELHNPEILAYKNTEPIPLPFAICCDSLEVVQDEPFIMIADIHKKKALPEKHPDIMRIGDSCSSQILYDYRVEIEKYLDSSYPYNDSGSRVYLPFGYYGGAPSCSVHVKEKDSLIASGWISPGNYLYPPKTLKIDSLHSVIMAHGEIQSITSVFRILVEDGESAKTIKTIKDGSAYFRGFYISQFPMKKRNETWSGLNRYNIRLTLFSLLQL